MLQSSLVAIGGGIGITKSGGVETPGGGIDPGISGDGAGGGGGGAGGGGAGAVGRVAATERTKTVLACLFEALGAKRATLEVGRVLCTLSAGTAAAAAAAEAPRGARGGTTEVEAVAPASAAVAPPALLPVLASLPERCVDIVGLALEVLETGQAAADALAKHGGADADRAVAFGSADSTGRWGRQAWCGVHNVCMCLSAYGRILAGRVTSHILRSLVFVVFRSNI